MGSRERGLFPGTVDLVILKTLSDGPLHGFGIPRTVRDRSDGVLEIRDAALYQALHRIERQGWIEAEWGLSENKRRAKFYRLTPEGARELEREGDAWRAFMGTVARALALEPAPQQGGAA